MSALAWAVGLACVLSLDDPRRRFPLFALAMVVAAAGSIGVSRGDPRLFRPLVALAICARLWALALPPAFSEDLFRYVYEGRLALHFGPLFAFVHAPADGPALGVPAELLDASWLRVNHAQVPTLYPPLAQATFAAGAWIGDRLGGLHAASIKALLVLAELAAAWLVARVDRRAGVLMALFPLAIVEVAREGHGDALALLGLAMGAAALVRARGAHGPARSATGSHTPGRAHARTAALGFAVATLGKLVGLVPLLVALKLDPKRAAWPALAIAALALFPYAIGGTGGITAYGGDWRSGDGLFSLVLALAQALLGGDWSRLGDHTVTAHQLARALTALGFAATAAVLLRARARPIELASLLLLLVLLWSPTVHPWYVLWLLPFAALAPRTTPPLLALLVLAPLLHHPGWLALDAGQWTDVPWLRALVHLPAWALLAALLVRRPRVV